MIIVLLWAIVALPCAVVLWAALRIHAMRGGL
jgi:hypothetical protein